MKYLQHLSSNHQNHVKIFTDGSKSSEGVGSAFLLDDVIYQGRLSCYASGYTAELTAIESALRNIKEHPKQNFVICTDSLSSISAIRQYNSFHPVVQSIQEWLYKLHTKFKTVHFCWVPSHVGIQKNEIVDKAAKDAASENHITYNRIPHLDMKRPIYESTLRKWQQEWSSPTLVNNKKYRNIRPTIEKWLSSYRSSRREEKILCRLRIGHTNLTHKFLLEGSSPPACEHCQEQLTVEHILVYCSAHSSFREKYHLDGKDLKFLLNDEGSIDLIINQS